MKSGQVEIFWLTTKSSGRIDKQIESEGGE